MHGQHTITNHQSQLVIVADWMRKWNNVNDCNWIVKRVRYEIGRLNPDAWRGRLSWRLPCCASVP
ncbi:hypothetical protein AG1IA_06606 [Rhizoctonia solani AG-1 IA]|uniref:Uncharacterized protein n=1 Tax=Thanatephorus cucumeris (strain AG1-IA) TaxID=983506 RepID=L8WRJ7_THACA|nr:hypothetical protein AG1IA_06606 [Rhizoctonia solani AG-1 IA]